MIIISRLHQMDQTVGHELQAAPGTLTQSFWDGSLLGPPECPREFAQRVSIFWQARPIFARLYRNLNLRIGILQR